MSNKENGDLNNIALSSDNEQGDGLSGLNTGSARNEAFPRPIGTISLDPDANPDDEEEKQRLIAQVLERQNTLDDLSSRVDSVKVENLKLKSENQVLGQYIENLMAASSVFQSASPKAKKK
ncbi:hypothetical protein RRG08_050212 [Elysia crispata]|uniref:Short coiled-coil protein n=1 Tax=Elysia crispata TaxID=231223 RepID=A0AAE0Z6V8_9GAST|nr:hypothetical protein RRG08_050212 [Elysia crispata]